MKTAREIVEELAKARRVEELCRNICKRPAEELNDLSQIVYLSLLKARPGIVCDLYEHGQLDYYLVRMIKNQYHSKDRAYYRENVEFQDRSSPLTDKEYEKADNQ